MTKITVYLHRKSCNVCILLQQYYKFERHNILYWPSQHRFCVLTFYVHRYYCRIYKKKICPTMYLYIKTSNMHMSYIVNTHRYVPCTHLCGTFVRETGKYGSARAILSATTRSFHAPFTFQFSSFPLYIFENSSIVYNPSRVYCKRCLSGVLYTIRYSYMLV